MKLILRIAILAFTLTFLGTFASAQTAPYKFDFGAALGMSGYIGDANTSNPFKKPGITADLRGAYIIDTRWQIRGLLSMMSLSGNTDNLKNVLPFDERYEFKSQVFDLSCRGEFNFFPYGIGESYKRLKRWTPFLAVGIGVSLASSNGNTAAGLSIPMTFGFKFKLKPRINLFAEFSMTKVFNDHIDSKELADLNHIKTDFYKSTDWFSRIAFGITYEFGKRCETCHYVD